MDRIVGAPCSPFFQPIDLVAQALVLRPQRGDLGLLATDYFAVFVNLVGYVAEAGYGANRLWVAGKLTDPLA